MFEKLNEIINWTIKNKEWIFSGVGISIIGALIFIIKKIFNNKKEENKNIRTININYSNNMEKPLLQQIENEELETFEDGMAKLVDRFISIYANHGILINQIPFFINPKFGLELSDFKDRQSILQILSDEIIQWTCNTFGVQREWLDGKSNKIYKHIDYYKNIMSCIDNLVAIKNIHNDSFECYFIKNSKLNPKCYGKHYVIIIFRYEIGKMNNTPIYKYIPISTNWDWGYWRCRYQLKSIIYFCEKLGIYINGYDMPLDIIEKISGGIVFPEPEINKIQISYTWYPEDYIDSPSESIQAKEIEENDLVIKYIEDEGYLRYFNEIKTLKEHTSYDI